ncbi:Ribokinase [Chlorella vulgaris]
MSWLRLGALRLIALCCALRLSHCSAASFQPILVVGSVNVDIIINVDRLPAAGETIMTRNPAADIAVGGKGANQAVAVARLAAGTGRTSRFVCQFGNDAHAAMMEKALVAEGVDVSASGHVDLPSGNGIVLLEPDGGATSIVLGGSNTAFEQARPLLALLPQTLPYTAKPCSPLPWSLPACLLVQTQHSPAPERCTACAWRCTLAGLQGPAEAWAALLEGSALVMLQREVPEHVNMAVAAAAKAAGIPVLLDVGGEDRPIADELLPLLDYLCPNESELARLSKMPTDTEQQVLAAAASLQRRGARNLLVTLGSRGALLITADGGVLRQAALDQPGSRVVDATAAGDAFRAAFAVALAEGRPLRDCLRFASAAGGIAVTRRGAVPSLPSRQETERLASSLPASGGSGGGSSTVGSDGKEATGDSEVDARALGGSPGTCAAALGASPSAAAMPADCPYRFASRLNSMQARRDLAGCSGGSNDVLGWVQRQSLVADLSAVVFNHPQHTAGHSPAQLRQALDAAGLAAGGVALRFPDHFALGAFTNPDPALRHLAVQMAAEGCRWAAELGAPDLVVWPQWDGYDYHFQVDYQAAWRWAVEGYRQLVDACPPGVRVSLEFKPTDESTRWSIVPSAAAALLLAQEVDRPSFGLTLDVGHMLLAGESPAQSVALVGGAGKLFGMHLNDAHVKLGAEDGLAFASVNPRSGLELVRWLHRVNFSGTIFFDTFPRKEDPVREAQHNVQRFKQLWAQAARLVAAGLDGFAATHDAVGVLELLAADEDRPAAAAAGA